VKNRYGDEYWFEEIEPNVYAIRGNLKYWRFGGREGTSDIDMADLGFVDPSGGPFISCGYVIEGRKVTRISARSKWDDPFQRSYEIIFEVEQ